MKTVKGSTSRVAALALALLLLASSAAAAKDPRPGGGVKRSTISVTGNGAVSIPPEYVAVSVGVRTEAKTASDALQENNALTSGVSVAILGLGIDGDDVVTDSIRLSPTTFYNKTTQRSEVTGFSASNTLTVNIRPQGDERELDELAGEVLTALVEEGINNINSVRFLADDTAAAADRARTMAVDDALAQAATFAGAAGYRVQGVKTMNVNDFNSPAPMDFVGAEFASPRMAAAPVATPISSGDITVSSSVDVVYFIVKDDSEGASD